MRLQGVAGVGKSMPWWYYRKKGDLQLLAIPPWSRPPCQMDVSMPIHPQTLPPTASDRHHLPSD